MKSILKETGLFSEKEIDYFLSFGKETPVKKGELFLKQGDVSKQVAFIKTGIFRSFYYSSKDEDVTYCFSFPGQLMAGYSSFITGEATEENIQALSNAELITFPKAIYDELLATNVNWLRFSKMIADEQYVKLEKRIFQLQKENAQKRYSELLTEYPQYILNIPLQYIASYLGISQRHLSRLRKQITLGQMS